MREVLARGVEPPIEGVRLVELTMHRDPRGCFTELFREEWGLGVSPVQWNMVTSHGNALRGMHLHLRHFDYLVVVGGRVSIALVDLREASPTFRQTVCVEVTGQQLRAMVVPPGVLHGFYIHEAATMLYGVTHYWDPADELGVRWDDPELAVPWPAEVRAPVLSERDAALPPLTALLDEIRPAPRVT
ncbi:MAG: dTDP-4-dehydrorhamnose 3,5-epimerase family protein [Armatimonadetes bacterium]|nr:dTDP-4-dehydrorhamnose 3,5-epimerase family protein [Armatimonadota bacterium]